MLAQHATDALSLLSVFVVVVVSRYIGLQDFRPNVFLGDLRIHDHFCRGRAKKEELEIEGGALGKLDPEKLEV